MNTSSIVDFLGVEAGGHSDYNGLHYLQVEGRHLLTF